MILEIALLQVRPTRTPEFEEAFAQARPLIARMHGHVRHELHRYVEDDHRYALLVWWATLEDHTVGFRGSPEYQEWRALLHHFYDPFPTVEHYRAVD
ncbi:antibiotic biosynthesis monooxygenase [Deinococcus taeanensis]|uniref:antibiotic biosynthesis monooxygenase family protein n=1 Tax=Deinococcus taeanensis TaxID=2737050 RepID=UPI001CDB8691|nr:antibiotic biosynthesis monooxygenase [Deinococcus taeanensis]UBV43641.1 antibiotic biosynthesis monooxygenase [Deinococcus taeanensis]